MGQVAYHKMVTAVHRDYETKDQSMDSDDRKERVQGIEEAVGERKRRGKRRKRSGGAKRGSVFNVSGDSVEREQTEPLTALRRRCCLI